MILVAYGLGAVGILLTAVVIFVWVRNDQVAAYFQAVNQHVFRINMAAITTGEPGLDWHVVIAAQRHWDRMIYMPWRPLASWFPPEYRP